jgi:hypothetical protein
MAGADLRLAVPSWYRALTAELLPLPLAEAYGLSLGAGERRLAARAMDRIRWIYPRLPERMRFVAPYHEARERLRGRGPGRLTRIGNRFWIGRASIGNGD